MPTKKKYAGRLGKPTRKNAIAALIYTPNSSARIDIEAELLHELCRHYGIDLTAKHRWLSLALCLARVHVPAFQITAAKGPGAPRKRRRTVSAPSQKVDGLQEHRQLVELVDAAIQRNGLNGRGKIKTALEIMIKEYLKAHGLSIARHLNRLVSAEQKNYSRAKKLIAKS